MFHIVSFKDQVIEIQIKDNNNENVKKMLIDGIQRDQYYFLVFQRDNNNTFYAYIDGVLKGEPLKYETSFAEHNCTIGNDKRVDYEEAFDGEIAQVKIYKNIYFTMEEIRLLSDQFLTQYVN